MFRLMILSALVTIALGRRMPDTRTEGGSDTTIEKHPWHCSLEISGFSTCSCTLIAWDRCLTSAQCTYEEDPANLSVRCGTTTLEAGGVVINVLSYNQHPNFTYYHKQSDLSIVHLEVPFSPSPQTGLIHLAKATDKYPYNKPLTCTSWDYYSNSKILQVLTLNLLQYCKFQHAGIFFDDSVICAEATPGKGLCVGDVGSPLVNKRTLIGVVSRTQGCANPNYPGVFASISALRSWIDSDLEV